MLSRSFVLALILVVPALSAGATAAPAQGSDEESGRVRVRAPELSLSGRVQTQFNTTSVDGERTAEWIIRRARFEVRVRANDLVSGKIQPDFAGERFTLKDAYVTLGFSPALEVLAGNAHRPFGILTRYSSLRMPPIEKGAEVRGMRTWDEVNLLKDLGYSSRDIGVQLLGAPERAPLGLEYELAFLRGPAADAVREGFTSQIVARLALSPLDRVTVGGSWSRRDFARPDGLPAPDELRSGNALALDLAIEPASSGLLLLGEITSGDFDPWRNATFRGAHVWLSYGLVPAAGRISMVEPLLRLSHGVLSGAPELSGGTMLTPGVNVYVGGLNRVMVNYDVWRRADGGTEGSFKTMLQLSF